VSILEAWEGEHEWEMNLPHIEDPIQADSKARIYAAAEKVIDRFDLDSTPGVALAVGDVAELVGAIAKDPAYPRPPKKPDLPKPKPPPETRLERIGARRAKRRHDGATETHFLSRPSCLYPIQEDDQRPARLHSGSNACGVHQPDAGRIDGAGGFGRPGKRPRASVREIETRGCRAREVG
jgi:hypothetical protein